MLEKYVKKGRHRHFGVRRKGFAPHVGVFKPSPYPCLGIIPPSLKVRKVSQSWALLGRSWDGLGRSWEALGHSWSASGTLLWRSWALLGPCWKKEAKNLFFGPQLGRQNTSRNREKSMLKNIFFSNTCFKWFYMIFHGFWDSIFNVFPIDFRT